MLRPIACAATLFLTASLAACGETEESRNNIVAENVNAAATMEEPLPAEPAVDVAAEAPATQPPASPRAAKPADPKPAPARARPAEPKPAEAKPATPPATDPNCPPEHREAGHC